MEKQKKEEEKKNNSFDSDFDEARQLAMMELMMQDAEHEDEMGRGAKEPKQIKDKREEQQKNLQKTLSEIESDGNDEEMTQNNTKSILENVGPMGSVVQLS